MRTKVVKVILFLGGRKLNFRLTLSLSEKAQSLLPFATSASILASRKLISQHRLSPVNQRVNEKSFYVILWLYSRDPFETLQLKEKINESFYKNILIELKIPESSPWSLSPSFLSRSISAIAWSRFSTLALSKPSLEP